MEAIKRKSLGKIMKKEDKEVEFFEKYATLIKKGSRFNIAVTDDTFSHKRARYIFPWLVGKKEAEIKYNELK